MKIDQIVCELVEYAVKCGLIEEYDRTYATSSVMKTLSLDSLNFCESAECRPLAEILSDICD